MRSLAGRGVVFSNLQLDTAIAAYLVDPAGDQYLLEDLAERYAGVELRAPDAPPPGQLDLSRDRRRWRRRRGPAGGRRGPPGRAHEFGAIGAGGMSKLYDEVERPLVRVLAEMEEAGVRVDVDGLRHLAGELAAEAKLLEAEIQDLAGVQFVVNSTPQLREILFNKLGLTPQKRTKTGLSRPTRRRSRSCGTNIRSSTPCCDIGRSRSCGRPTASRCWPRSLLTGGSMPPSTRPWRAPAGSARTSRICTTSRSGARRAAASASASCRRKAANSWSPITTRSSCG